MSQKSEEVAIATFDPKLLYELMEPAVFKIAESIRGTMSNPPTKVVAQLLAIQAMISWLQLQSAYVQKAAGITVTDAGNLQTPPVPGTLQ